MATAIAEPPHLTADLRALYLSTVASQWRPLVICDELGYVPLDKAGADLLFGFISQRYERGSLVVTTNLPFTRWSEVFLDPTAAAAVIDRVVHHATVLQTTGGSFRLAAAKQNQAPAAGKKGAR